MARDYVRKLEDLGLPPDALATVRKRIADGKALGAVFNVTAGQLVLFGPAYARKTASTAELQAGKGVLRFFDPSVKLGDFLEPGLRAGGASGKAIEWMYANPGYTISQAAKVFSITPSCLNASIARARFRKRQDDYAKRG